MADPPAGEAGFREQFTRFAEEIRHLVNAVFAETSTSPYSMESLHLPVGGDRFRPCLEDVIEFLVVECRFDSTAGWRAAVQAGRERWRRTQTRTVVRDSPGEAAAALRALGYTVAVPGSVADLQDDVVRMRRW